MALDDIDVAAESRNDPPPSPAGADIGSLIRPMSEGLSSLQREKNERTERIYSDTEKNLEHDQTQVARAYAATGIGPNELKPWDHAKQEEKYRTDPIEAFGSLGSVFGIVASAFTHAPMENALNASAAAIKATKEGNDEQFKRAYQSWKDNTELAVKRHNMMRDSYADAVTLMKTNMAAGEARMSMEAARFGDKKAQFLLENGMSEELFKLIDSRNKAATGMLEASNAITEDGMRHKVFDGQMKAIDENTQGSQDPNAKQMAAAHKLAAFQTIFDTDKKSPAQQMMGRFFLEKPNATAEEAADYAKKIGLVHQYRTSPEGMAIEAEQERRKNAGEPEMTGAEIATLVGSMKGRGSQGSQSLTVQRQNAKAADDYAKDLRDKNKEMPEDEVQKKRAQKYAELQAASASPSGNQIDWMKGQVFRITEAQSVIDKSEAMMKKHNALTGLGGKITRPAEALSNVFGSNATDRAQFESYILELKEWGPRLLNESKGKPLASEAEKIDKIIRGLNWGDTTANTARNLKELRDTLERFKGNLDQRIGGGAGGAQPPKTGGGDQGTPAWKRAPIVGPKAENDSDEMAA